MRSRARKAQRLRFTVETLPRHTREAMLRGIDANPIIVGAYTDKNGGVCPMLAAHRNGGRTSFASFARAWDDYTGVTRRPRRASRREVRMLRAYLEMSIIREDSAGGTLVEAADQIRDERRAFGSRAPGEPPQSSDQPKTPADRDRFRAWDLRARRRPARKRPQPLDLYEATFAASIPGIPRETDDSLSDQS